MALYLIERTDEIDYDEYASFIVRAGSEKEAIALVADPEKVTCRHTNLHWGVAAGGSNLRIKRIPEAGERGVIVESFNAG